MKIEAPVKTVSKDEANKPDQTSQTIRLRDSRILGYAEYGDHVGEAVFYFHGSPSSRLEASAWDETAMRLNIRIIAVDRPGMGLSTFQKDRCILDFPADVSELADSLNIDKFAIIGMSGGGPYVSACAYKLPYRVTVAEILSGSGLYNPGNRKDNIIWPIRLTYWLNHNTPWLMRLIFALVMGQTRRRRNTFFWMSLSEPDKAVLDITSIADAWVESIIEAFHSGTKGPVKDFELINQLWGFDPGKISVPMRIWHGQLDRNVPIAAAKRLADRIPNCKAYFFPEEGHFSLWLNQMEEILKEIAYQSHKKNNTYELIVSR